MADFTAVIRRAVDGLAENNPENREGVYDKARGAVRHQLENMWPRPSDDLMRRQLDKLEISIGEVEGAAQGFFPPHTLEGFLPEEELEEPRIPNRAPGLAYFISSTGRVDVDLTGVASSEDLLEVSPIRRVLVRSLDDLNAAAEGSNSYGHLARIAGHYRDVLTDSRGLSIDLLYAEGIRLENARRRISDEVRTGDSPPMAIPVSEALDSIIALHGPLIVSTERGRQLLSRSQLYDFQADREQIYKELATRVAVALKKSSELLEPRGAEELIRINEEIGTGENLQRTAELAHTANRNLWVTIAKFTVATITADALQHSAPGALASEAVRHLFDASFVFLSAHHQLLAEFAAATGSELSWLDPFIRWFERQRMIVTLEAADLSAR